MIAQIRGRLLRKGPQEAIVDVGGVGYRVTIPLSTFYKVGEPGAEVTLLTHTHVREDTLALFGFLTAVEQALFERLIAVSGVGPKLAVSVLSGIEAPELVAALRSGDVARLTRIPGVGKKTAERLVVELKDKMSDLETADVAPAAAPSPEADDLVSALLHLGYSRAEADRAVERTMRWGAGAEQFGRPRIDRNAFAVEPAQAVAAAEIRQVPGRQQHPLALVERGARHCHGHRIANALHPIGVRGHGRATVEDVDVAFVGETLVLEHAHRRAAGGVRQADHPSRFLG